MEIPRRARVDQWTPAEHAIGAAVEAVEAVGADVRLTDAVILLQAAKDSVSDYVDGIKRRRTIDITDGLDVFATSESRPQADRVASEWWLCVQCRKAYRVPTTAYHGNCGSCGAPTQPCIVGATDSIHAHGNTVQYDGDKCAGCEPTRVARVCPECWTSWGPAEAPKVCPECGAGSVPVPQVLSLCADPVPIMRAISERDTLLHALKKARRALRRNVTCRGGACDCEDANLLGVLGAIIAECERGRGTGTVPA